MELNTQNNDPILEGQEEGLTGLEKFEIYLQLYKNQILYGFLAILAVVICITSFRYYSQQQNLKAQNEIYAAQALFEQGDFEQALAGFEAVIDDLGSTDAGNTAKAYAGLCNKELGNYEAAISQLKSFSGDDAVIAPAMLCALGDCYVNSAEPNYKEAANCFEKAAQASNSAQFSPLYLQKAGLCYEEMGDKAQALKIYQSIQKDWFETTIGQNVDKYIERVK